MDEKEKSSGSGTEKPSIVKVATSIMRIPITLLLCGLLNYALVRKLAPAVDPGEFSNVIGLGAILEALLIEGVRRFLQRQKITSTAEGQ